MANNTQHYKRVILAGVGGPEALEVITAPLPEPEPGEVRIKVQATGISFADVACRLGKYPTAPTRPFTPGYDLAGVVDALGAGVTGLNVGQPVAAILPKFGANAEYVTVPEALVVPMPEGLDPAAAVSIVLNYLTAHRLLHKTASVQPGERVLVHSAAGGVGTALLELGRIAELALYGTASQAKHDLLQQYGATPIDYRSEDFVARIGELTNGEGVDVVMDAVGGEVFRRSYGILRRGGRLISYGYLSAASGGPLTVPVTLLRVYLYRLRPDGKRTLFYGSTPPMARSDNAWYRETLGELLRLLHAGQITPVIGARFPLDEVADAHALFDEKAVRGKIVLVNAE
ncbi:MAG: zinc-binding dehydrogenase [Chloroflexi bacterium]|nr:zinc-binding dehydrogenase [Chloroflexota bacterium]